MAETALGQAGTRRWLPAPPTSTSSCSKGSRAERAPPAPPAPPWGHLMAQAPLRVTAPQCKLQGTTAEHVAFTRFAEPAASLAPWCHLARTCGHLGTGTPEDGDTWS